MAEMSDFLGHILEELTRARVQADIEAIRTARRYIDDEDGLLKNFPIPRMRLPNIEITLPIVISDVPDGYVEKTDASLLSQRLAADVKKLLAAEKLTLSVTEINSIIRSDDNLSRGFLSAISAESISTKMGSRVKEKGGKPIASSEVHERVTRLIKQQIDKTFEALPRKALGISINPRTAAVKEFGSASDKASSVVMVKMSITEDALEMDFRIPPEPEPVTGKPAPGGQVAPVKNKPVLNRLIPE
jgi:hypothetical protein